MPNGVALKTNIYIVNNNNLEIRPIKCLVFEQTQLALWNNEQRTSFSWLLWKDPEQNDSFSHRTARKITAKEKKSAIPRSGFYGQFFYNGCLTDVGDHSLRWIHPKSSTPIRITEQL